MCPSTLTNKNKNLIKRKDQLFLIQIKLKKITDGYNFLLKTQSLELEQYILKAFGPLPNIGLRFPIFILVINISS